MLKKTLTAVSAVILCFCTNAMNFESDFSDSMKGSPCVSQSFSDENCEGWDSQLSDLYEDNEIREAAFSLKKLLKEEPARISIERETMVVGDIHGDLLSLMMVITKYAEYKALYPRLALLFLGDYIDRGDFGLEVLVVLAKLKSAFSQDVFLLRGNHETLEMTYGAPSNSKMCNMLGNPTIYNMFLDARLTCDKIKSDKEYFISGNGELSLVGELFSCFEFMPTHAIVGPKGNQWFCVHGGVPSNQYTPEIDQLIQKKIPMYLNSLESNSRSYLKQMLWSDPRSKFSFDGNQFGRPAFDLDSVRVLNSYFGTKGVIRAHQVPQNKEKIYPYFSENQQEKELVTTVFSSLYYCQKKEEGASVVLIKPEGRDVIYLDEYENNKTDFHDRVRSNMSYSFGELFNETVKCEYDNKCSWMDESQYNTSDDVTKKILDVLQTKAVKFANERMKKDNLHAKVKTEAPTEQPNDKIISENFSKKRPSSLECPASKRDEEDI